METTSYNSNTSSRRERRQNRGEAKSSAAYRTISEVATDLDVAPHVLRFWETKFPEIKPVKRAGGRRNYRPEDIELLQTIQTLLYKEGYTIRGVQTYLRKTGCRKAAEQTLNSIESVTPNSNNSDIKSIVSELKQIRKILG